MSIDDQLNSLTKNEVTVLFYKCKGLKYDQIATRLDYSKDWVQLHMSSVYAKLDFNKEMHWTRRRSILENEVCPLLPKNLEDWQPVKAITEGIKEDALEESEANPQMMALVIYDEQAIEQDKNKSVVPPTKPKTIIFQEPSTAMKSFRQFFFALLTAVIVSILAIFIYNFGRNSVPLAPPEVMIITATFPPATETALASSTSPIPTDTLVPTTLPTPIPTNSPVPTEFIPPADEILFQDNFDSGDLSAWNQLSGQWLVSDGKLTKLVESTNTYQWISLKRPEWINYIVSMDVYKPSNSNTFAVAIRNDTTKSKLIGFSVDYGDDLNLMLIAYDYYDNSLITANSGVEIPYNSNANIEIEVQGDTYILRTSDREVQRITLPGYESGGISIGVICSNESYGCATFDNVKVTYLP